MAGLSDGGRGFGNEFDDQIDGNANYSPSEFEDADNTERTSPSSSPAGRSRSPSPPAFGYQPGYYPRAGESIPLEAYQRFRPDTNDNPLYETEDEIEVSVQGQQGTQSSTNPLYGNDPFTASQAVCMTEFLRPKGPRSPRRREEDASASPERYDDDQGQVPYIGRENVDGAEWGENFEYAPSFGLIEPYDMQQKRPKSPGFKRSSPPRRAPYTVRSYPPDRYSPIPPPKQPASPRPLTSGRIAIATSDAKPSTTKPGGTTPAQAIPASGRPAASRVPRPQFAVQSLRDLVAAVRSDQNLLKAEVRRDTGREPRIPGDHDRYFAPRKGDIIIHFTPTLDNDNKLVEYFDERKTMQRMMPGDKLVRVKYDNYRIPDHLMITSKLYIYVPEWIYLGKAVQTIKTA